MLAPLSGQAGTVQQELTTTEWRAGMTQLTPYDTGARAEPKVWEERHRESEDDYGKVDFNADDDYTIATLHIEKDTDGTYVLRGYGNEPLKVEIETNDDLKTREEA